MKHIIISTKENMFSVVLVRLLVSNITKKFINGLQWNFMQGFK